MTISNKAPSDFIEWQKKLKISLEAKGIKQAHIYRAIGMSQTTWLRRLRKLNFTAKEALAICEVLNK